MSYGGKIEKTEKRERNFYGHDDGRDEKKTV